MRVTTTTSLGTSRRDRPQSGKFAGSLPAGSTGTLGTSDDADRLIPHLVETGEPWEVFFPDDEPNLFVAICADWYEEAT